MSVLGGVVPWQERIKDSVRKMAVAVTQLMIYGLMKATVKQILMMMVMMMVVERKRGREEEQRGRDVVGL